MGWLKDIWDIVKDVRKEREEKKEKSSLIRKPTEKEIAEYGNENQSRLRKIAGSNWFFIIVSFVGSFFLTDKTQTALAVPVIPVGALLFLIFGVAIFGMLRQVRTYVPAPMTAEQKQKLITKRKKLEKKKKKESPRKRRG